MRAARARGHTQKGGSREPGTKRLAVGRRAAHPAGVGSRRHPPTGLTASHPPACQQHESQRRGPLVWEAWAVWNPQAVEHPEGCFVAYAHPTPTESSVGAKVPEAARWCPVPFGSGTGSLPAVHDIGGHDASGGHEPPPEQRPGAGGHGPGAGAGDAAGQCEAADRGRTGLGGSGQPPRPCDHPPRCRPRPHRRSGTMSPPCTTGWTWNSSRKSSV